jgi:hypothetical protein
MRACMDVGRIFSCLLHITGYSNFMEWSYSVEDNNSTAYRKNSPIWNSALIHSVQPRLLVVLVLSWMIRVGTLFNVL